MNFHKTIGFLATLLLVFGLGVPDSFAQVTVTGINPSTIMEQDTPVTVEVTVTVTVTVAEAITVSAGQVHTITAATSTTEGISAAEIVETSNANKVTIPEGKTSASKDMTVALTVGYDDNPNTEYATLTFTTDATGVDAGTIKIKVIDRRAKATSQNATHINGIKVEVVKPGAGEYVMSGEDVARVRIHRRSGAAHNWGQFGVITVAFWDDDDDDDKLKDTATGNDVMMGSLTFKDSNGYALGTLDAEGVLRDTLIATDSDPQGQSIKNIFYTRRTGRVGFDILEFRFTVNKANDGKEGDKVYAIVSFGTNPNDINNTFASIDSRDTKTDIYPSNPQAIPGKVGDGKLVKWDVRPPVATLVSAITVMANNKPGVTDATPDDQNVPHGPYAGIGKEITIEATGLAAFAEHSVIFKIRAVDAVTKRLDGNDVIVAEADEILDGWTGTVGALAIIDNNGTAAAKFKVASGQFKRVYTTTAAGGDAPPDEKKFRDTTYRKGKKFQADNVEVYVAAFVRDAAGNEGVQSATSLRFILDSKPPKVTLAYPDSSHKRFTAKVTDVDRSFHGSTISGEKLKPVNFKVDEAMSKGHIIVGTAGTDTLNLKATQLTDEDEAADYNLVSLALKNAKLPNGKANKKPHQDSKQGGSAVNLTIVAFDKAGNKGMATPKAGTSGKAGQAIFDAKSPAVKAGTLFPNTTALADYDNKIGDGTQHPVFQINEVTDSILVRYGGNYRTLDKAGTAAQLKMVNKNIRFMFTGKDSLRQNEQYNLQVYVRDLAGHVNVSDIQSNLTFDNGVNNPEAGGFKVAAMDSVVAGQPMAVTVTALDTMLTRTAKKDRVAVTYDKAGVMVVAMDSDGAMVSNATFWGSKSVTDNGDGSATLGSAGWSVGKHEINVILKTAEAVTIVAKDMTADGVLNFSGEKTVTVDAADFAKFDITPMEDGAAVQEVYEDFTLVVTPTDRYGNPSVKAYRDAKPTGDDSLKILDSRVDKKSGDPAVTNGFNYKNGFDITLRSLPDIGLPPFEWTIELDDEFTRTFSVSAPSTAKQVAIQVRVDNTSLMDGDERSENVKTNKTFKVSAPLTPTLSLTVPGKDGDQSGNDVEIRDGSITVTVNAMGFNAGSDVTFTKNGTAMDAVTADDDGNATLDITMSEAGTVTVSAASGQYSTDALSITFVVQEGRQEFTDADGNAVYFVADGKTSGTVGVDDFLAFVAAYGSSEGDDNFNVQADLDDDGDVDLDDFLEFIKSYGREIPAPATKPLVLLPGINENAEFALNLGSERVVAGELVAVDVSVANVEALMGYGFTLNYDATKFDFVSVAPADEDLLASTGGETLFHHVVADGQVSVATGMYNGTAVSGGGDIVQFVFRVLHEFEDIARFEIADGLVFDPSQLQNPAVVAGVLELQSTPREFALHQNFPNPFNPDTTIKYDLAESADVTLQIYNVLGQVVRTLVASEAQNAGRYQIRWNGMDERGVPVSSGIYFYQISADGKFSDVRKLMLLK